MNDRSNDDARAEQTIHAMIAEACFGTRSEEELASGLAAFLEASGVGAEDAAAILAAPRRLGLYRRLVRNNLAGVTETMLPRTRARVNALAGGAFDATFDAFLAEVGPRTHFLRDVPRELVAWATPRWASDPAVPAYAADLAALELVEYEVAAAPDLHALPPLVDVALDRPLVTIEAKRLLRCAHAVHTLPADVDDRSVPAARATSLLVYRDAEHAVRFLELTPLAAAILARLFEGDALGAAVTGGCAELGVASDGAVLESTARLLADLGERGVLLGARGEG